MSTFELTYCHSKGPLSMTSLGILSALSSIYMCRCSANITAKFFKWLVMMNCEN